MELPRIGEEDIDNVIGSREYIIWPKNYVMFTEICYEAREGFAE